VNISYECYLYTASLLHCELRGWIVLPFPECDMRINEYRIFVFDKKKTSTTKKGR